MNAMIFAAGLGTRLKPLTDSMPKAMVPVGGKPLIQILIERLKAAGVTEIVINVHHFAQQIINFVNENDMFGVNVRFSDETDLLLETGGGLKKAATLFTNNEPILVHNVDIISNADLKSLYGEALHTTMLVSERKTSRYLLFNDNNELMGWTNISTGEVKSPYSNLDISKLHRYAFSGIQVFNQELLPYMDAWDGKFSIIEFYLSICNRVKIFCKLEKNLRLIDVGKLDTLTKAEEALNW